MTPLDECLWQAFWIVAGLSIANLAISLVNLYHTWQTRISIQRLRANLLDLEPSMHLWYLRLFIRQKRDKEATMLVDALETALRKPYPRRHRQSPNSPNSIDSNP